MSIYHLAAGASSATFVSVCQDDLLYEALTVYETLYFAAMLRLPQHMTKVQKLERVATVIRVLGLRKCKDTIIGTGLMHEVRGASIHDYELQVPRVAPVFTEHSSERWPYAV